MKGYLSLYKFSEEILDDAADLQIKNSNKFKCNCGYADEAGDQTW